MRTRAEVSAWRESLCLRRAGLRAEMERGMRENWDMERRLELVARVEAHNKEARESAIIQPCELVPRDGDWERYMYEATA